MSLLGLINKWAALGRIVKHQQINLKKRWSTMQILAFGFAFLILLGSVLLWLPISNRNHESIPFLNALFTATSATCVTGLVVYDTWTQFSGLGQAVILLLIQIGGLGFIAVAIMFSLTLGKRIGLYERSLLTEVVSSLQIGGIVRLVRRMLIGTALFEVLGAALLGLRFIPLFGMGRGLWFSIFHSVSAFCNAGFDLMGVNNPHSSLTAFVDDPLVILVIAMLIIVGGISFVVWNDLIEVRFSLRKILLQTRIVLFSTFFLLLAGTLAFLLLEKNNVLSSMNSGTRILAAFFQSVTPRTAGFNSLDITSLSSGGEFITILLMFIGAAPGSTGGGIKVTTLVVIGAALIASIRNRSDVTIWHFRLNSETLQRAFTGAALYLMMVTVGIIVLCAEGQSLSDSIFECFSAIGTVGLTTGITTTLSPLSRIVLIVLMYAGRIGSMTVFLAVTKSVKNGALKNPVGKVIVG